MRKNAPAGRTPGWAPKHNKNTKMAPKWPVSCSFRIFFVFFLAQIRGAGLFHNFSYFRDSGVFELCIKSAESQGKGCCHQKYQAFQIGGGRFSSKLFQPRKNIFIGAKKNHDSHRRDRIRRDFLHWIFRYFLQILGARLTKLHREPGEKAKNPVESLQWRRRSEIADFCPLSWSNVS